MVETGTVCAGDYRMRTIHLGAREVEEVEEEGMKRYYYTCPLQAAYMAKEFGMKLALRDDYSPTSLAEDDGRVIDYSLEIIDSDLRWKDGTCFYIHPDSLHLLEPQIGDIVLNCDDDPARVVRDGKNLGHYEVSLHEARKYVGKEASIIQRNGKPFFWPEVEG